MKQEVFIKHGFKPIKDNILKFPSSQIETFWCMRVGEIMILSIDCHGFGVLREGDMKVTLPVPFRDESSLVKLLEIFEWKKG